MTLPHPLAAPAGGAPKRKAPSHGATSAPQPSELLEFMQFKKPSLDFAGNRLQSALTIYDLRRIAKRRTPAAASDYTDGAAEGELSMTRARQAFEDVEFTRAS